LEKRTIKSAATVLSFLQVADPDGDKGDASPPVYSNFVCVKISPDIIALANCYNQKRFFHSKSHLKRLVNGLRRCPQGGAHRAPPETLARFKGAALWQRKTGKKQGMDKRGKEREGIVALPTPGVDGLERLRLMPKLLDCFENRGHGRIRQRNHLRQISCQLIQAVRF